MDDPRNTLFDLIDLNSCRIEFSDSPIVLLCGGKVIQKPHPDAPDPEITSFRHAFSLQDTSYEVFRPEEITTWQSDSVFKNLMDFESDLASICSLVVIILESAGAIAELGAFSQLSDLSKKLIVIKSNQFNEDSFINLGILRHIAKHHASSVKSYPWDINNPKGISHGIINDTISDIEEELNQLPKSKVLKPNMHSHIAVLICEIISLFVAVKESEILHYLDLFGTQIDKDNLKGKLFLLEKFRLVKKQQYSDSIFYIRSREPYHKLRLSAKKGKVIDALRIPIECIEFYKESTKDRHRSRAIKELSLGEEK